MRVPVSDIVKATLKLRLDLPLFRPAVRSKSVSGPVIRRSWSGREFNESNATVEGREELTARFGKRRLELPVSCEVVESSCAEHDDDVAPLIPVC